jgi:phosphoserine phosphatase RsbU/P
MRFPEEHDPMCCGHSSSAVVPSEPRPAADATTKERAPPHGFVERVLVADDDPTHRLLLRNMLAKWGFDVELHGDGESAWEAMQRADAPHLLIVDWMMPGIDGLELCRRVRTIPTTQPTYIIMLTGRDEREDIVVGLLAGADDYLSKPAHRDELHARIRNGVRIIELQLKLARKIHELESALARVNQLQGLLPICAYCKKVRSDGNYWQQVEAYFATHSDVRFSHGICPGCYETIVEPELEALETK